jgi:hypothetical protein
VYDGAIGERNGRRSEPRGAEGASVAAVTCDSGTEAVLPPSPSAAGGGQRCGRWGHLARRRREIRRAPRACVRMDWVYTPAGAPQHAFVLGLLGSASLAGLAGTGNENLAHLGEPFWLSHASKKNFTCTSSESEILR